MERRERREVTSWTQTSHSLVMWVCPCMCNFRNLHESIDDRRRWFSALGWLVKSQYNCSNNDSIPDRGRDQRSHCGKYGTGYQNVVHGRLDLHPCIKSTWALHGSLSLETFVFYISLLPKRIQGKHCMSRIAGDSTKIKPNATSGGE